MNPTAVKSNHSYGAVISNQRKYTLSPDLSFLQICSSYYVISQARTTELTLNNLNLSLVWTSSSHFARINITNYL